MLLRNYISQINKNFSGLIPGIKVYGLAQSVIRETSSGEELLPGIVDQDGEITYVGLDDEDPVRLYHRLAGLTTGRITGQGYGDNHNDIVNTYQMVIICYINHKRSKLFPEELFLYLQANIPDALKVEPYKTITIKTGNVIFNSQLVFRAEYAGSDFKLPAEHSLFQINYTIETVFKKNCFEKCPNC